MSNIEAVPWGRLAVLTGALLTLTIVARGMTTVARIALGEVGHRAGAR